MGSVVPIPYTELVIRKASDLSFPAAPRRRKGTETSYAAAWDDIQRDLTWISQEIQHGREQDAEEETFQIALELLSFLYSCGAEPKTWQAWAELASIGSRIRGTALDAVSYAVLSGIPRIPPDMQNPPPSSDIQATVLWKLAVEPSLPLPDTRRADDFAEAWLRLSVSIPAQRHADTETSLQSLADFWIQEDEEWDLFIPRSYPCFDPYVCAAAALACRGGYRPSRLSATARLFLDPGLT
ncbi:hypothetical protein [Streptomyces sp. NPDC020951]|uniref:hypothetical protein n=1 Tax=Streptomyces sp. NPDC020951 TaxID=3365104 RepID=UPI0037B9B789